MFNWQKVIRDLFGLFAVAGGLATALGFCLTLTLSEGMSFWESIRYFWMFYIASLLSVTGGILHIMGKRWRWLIIGVWVLLTTWAIMLSLWLESWS